MTATASPEMSLAELARERSASNASKHAEYEDRAGSRSPMTMDYTSSTNNNAVRHQQPQHYSEEHENQYPEEYHDQQQLQQQQQQHYNNNNGNGYSHPSALPPSSQPHYPHGSAANGSYPPPPIQTTQFGNGAGGNSVHPHAQSAMHNSFASPTSPALSPSPLSPGTSHNPYQQPQQGHYEYDQYHSQSYHAHHTSYPQDHHPHPMSPNVDGSGPGQFYAGYPIPVGGKVEDASNGNGGFSANGTPLSDGSYSSSASPTHYPRHSYGHHHGGIDDQSDSPMGMAVGPDGMPANGSRDSNVNYSSSAPSPTSSQAMLGTRAKRRSESYAPHQSPYFYPAQQHYNLLSMDRSESYNLKISAKIDRGFFLAENDWTCYRRNYFQISASFSIAGLDTSVHPETPCLMDRNSEFVQINKFLICIGSHIQHGDKTIELVQHTPKRDKGPQITPRPTPVRAGGDLSMYSSGSNPNVVTFERVQFKTATANNGKRRAAQQYYQVHVDLFAETDTGELVLVASSLSAPLVVRGRSPGHYADNEEGTPGSSTQPMDGRYYRNDSISSSSNGGPMSPSVNGDYPYYPSYGYGPSYQYQSLGSASHIAQSQDPNYYERHDSESYPTSPLSPGARHPGAMEASQPHHPYMTPQVHHGFSPASVSPDMYSPSSFIPTGAESPTSFNRLPHMQGHPNQEGHYSYGSPPYSQYPQQQQQDQYDQDQDHEAQMAGLRIHSPVGPGSPVQASARRQSFSTSLSSKKGDRGAIGPTRKSRSISMSGINKRVPSKPKPSRTAPVSPTKELSKGLGISSDRIPEEDQQS